MAATLYLLDTVLIALMTGRELGVYLDATYSLRARALSSTRRFLAALDPID